MLAVSAVCGLILPEIVHIIGDVTGVGALTGETLLPMHLPVIIAAFLSGSFVGGAAGLMVPLLSFAFTGMPSAAVLPFILAELCAYGITAGLLREKKMPFFLKLLTVQLCGRAVRLAFTAVGAYAFGSAVTTASVLSAVVAGIPGIIVQWVVVTAVVKMTEKKVG